MRICSAHLEVDGTGESPAEHVRGEIYPYFIGVFDTVAAFGATGFKRIAMIALAAMAVVGAAAVGGWR